MMRAISQSDVKMARCWIQGHLRHWFRFLSYLLCYVERKTKNHIDTMSSTYAILFYKNWDTLLKNVVQSFKLNARWLIFDCNKTLLKMQYLLHDHVVKIYWFYKIFVSVLNNKFICFAEFFPSFVLKQW